MANYPKWGNFQSFSLQFFVVVEIWSKYVRLNLKDIKLNKYKISQINVTSMTAHAIHDNNVEEYKISAKEKLYLPH